MITLYLVSHFREIAITTLKILLSWAIAIFEYLPLTMANSVADKAKIKLTNLRGAIEAMDLAWFVLFIYFAKHARLNWHQYVGLALAGIGKWPILITNVFKVVPS